MLKRLFSVLLIVVMVMGLAACGDKQTSGDDNWKIAIMTGTVVQNEEEYRAAEAVMESFTERFGEGHVVIMTYPAKFMDEQETTISNVVSMVSDPDVKALVFVQAIPGASAAIDKAREINPDLLVIAGTAGEDPKMIASRADIVFQMDELGMGIAIPAQAKKQGAKVFVHYSFPRHMSYALLAARRELFKEQCEELGLEFVDATAPDPTGDAGVSGAQQFILEDVPRKVEKYGKDTAFFSTNCSMMVPLIKASLEEGAIFPQPCCPSPYHGYPSALGIEVPEDKKGDVDYMISEIDKAVDAKGGDGRFSTWAVPINMMYIEAGAEYAKAYIDGETDGKLDRKVLQEKFEAYAGSEVGVEVLVDGGETYDNYLMILMDFLNF